MHSNYKCDHYVAQYRAGGHLVFLSRESQLVRISAYELQFGSVHNLRQPVSEDGTWLTLDVIDGLSVGDTVELRNEYQLARANLPVRHHCRVIDIREGRIQIEPPVPHTPSLRSQQGGFLVRLQACTISRWDLGSEEREGSTATWVLNGSTDIADVALRIVMCTERKDVLIDVIRTFRSDIRIFSEKLILDQLPPLREVYRKNRQIDTGSFQRRYNVSHEGALFSSDGNSGVYVYGSFDATSLDIASPGAVFTLRALTPFRAAPNDLGSLGHGDVYHYASARPTKGEVSFELALSDTQEIHALVLHWYKELRPKRVVALAETGGDKWIKVIDAPNGREAVDSFALTQPARTRRLRVSLLSDESIALRRVDVRVGGSGFTMAFNLDDHRDHRFCRYLEPTRRTEDMAAMVMEMRSASTRRQGDEVRNCCRLVLGAVPPFRPRILHVPGGAQSLLVWTEHADRASLESHRATCFGRSNIGSASSATGGFVSRGIPMTKSVFLANPKRQPCSKTHGVPQVSLEDSPEFLAFCKELSALGHEICIHAPHPTNSPPAAGQDAARHFAKEFHARTWIDHSARVIHCAMSSQGLNSDSPYFMAKTWHESGFRYFWQFASEDASEQRVGSVNIQQTLLGDWLHTPLYWRHPTETGDFISWPTLRGGDLDVYDERSLDRLVADWGVCITHTYAPAHYDDPSRSQYLIKDADGTFASSPVLESVLARFADRRARGELAIRTIGEILDYWMATESVQVEYEPGGTTRMTNRSGQCIKGFTFACPGPIKLPSGIRQRPVGEDVLVTLDFPASASLCISGSEGGAVLSIAESCTNDS